MKGTELLDACRKLTGAQLRFELQALTTNERLSLIKVLARLAEVGRRELEKEWGHSSLFYFCVKELRYCEATAHYRTKAATACARFPVLLELLEAGELHIKAVALLEDHLTIENHETLIARAKGKPYRDLERLVAGLRPLEKPPEKARVIAVVVAPSARAEAKADELSLGPAMVEIRTEHRFSVRDVTEEKLARARELLSHKFPMGDLESIFDVALDALLDRIDPSRKGARPDKEPRDTETRRIPEWIKRKVRERDGDRCAYVSETGVRCGERRFLQFDHIKPWSRGGKSDDPANIRQACASHNQWLARRMKADGFWEKLAA